MQIKFKKSFLPEEPIVLIQAELLKLWQRSLEDCQVKYIQKANVSFVDYDITEYPDQALLCKELMDSNIEEAKDNPEQFIKSLAGKLRMMELVIAPEDYE